MTEYVEPPIDPNNNDFMYGVTGLTEGLNNPDLHYEFFDDELELIEETLNQKAFVYDSALYLARHAAIEFEENTGQALEWLKSMGLQEPMWQAARRKVVNKDNPIAVDMGMPMDKACDLDQAIKDTFLHIWSPGRKVFPLVNPRHTWILPWLSREMMGLVKPRTYTDEQLKEIAKLKRPERPNCIAYFAKKREAARKEEEKLNGEAEKKEKEKKDKKSKLKNRLNLFGGSKDKDGKDDYKCFVVHSEDDDDGNANVDDVMSKYLGTKSKKQIEKEEKAAKDKARIDELAAGHDNKNSKKKRFNRKPAGDNDFKLGMLTTNQLKGNPFSKFDEDSANSKKSKPRNPDPNDSDLTDDEEWERRWKEKRNKNESIDYSILDDDLGDCEKKLSGNKGLFSMLEDLLNSELKSKKNLGIEDDRKARKKKNYDDYDISDDEDQPRASKFAIEERKPRTKKPIKFDSDDEEEYFRKLDARQGKKKTKREYSPEAVLSRRVEDISDVEEENVLKSSSKSSMASSKSSPKQGNRISIRIPKKQQRSNSVIEAETPTNIFANQANLLRRSSLIHDSHLARKQKELFEKEKEKENAEKELNQDSKYKLKSVKTKEFEENKVNAIPINNSVKLRKTLQSSYSNLMLSKKINDTTNTIKLPTRKLNSVRSNFEASQKIKDDKAKKLDDLKNYFKSRKPKVNMVASFISDSCV